MKKIFILLSIIFFLSGCGSVISSGFGPYTHKAYGGVRTDLMTIIHFPESMIKAFKKTPLCVLGMPFGVAFFAADLPASFLFDSYVYCKYPGERDF